MSMLRLSRRLVAFVIDVVHYPPSFFSSFPFFRFFFFLPRGVFAQLAQLRVGVDSISVNISSIFTTFLLVFLPIFFLFLFLVVPSSPFGLWPRMSPLAVVTKHAGWWWRKGCGKIVVTEYALWWWRECFGDERCVVVMAERSWWQTTRCVDEKSNYTSLGDNRTDD